MEAGSERRKGTGAQRAAYEAAMAEPMEHKPRLVTSRHAREQVHGVDAVGRFNNWLAVLITRSVGTMWAAYLFAVIGITALVGAMTGNLILTLVVGGFSSYFLQLVLLPVIIVGQNVISTAQDARAEADHLTLTALHTINVQQLKLLQQQAAILDMLQSKEIAPPAQAS
jgi:hypothetical protein